MPSILHDTAKSFSSPGDPFVTELMRQVALQIMDDREAVHRHYFFVDEQTYAQLFADTACWCEQTSRPMVTRQHVADRYIPNFEFAGTFVTCCPEEYWPPKPLPVISQPDAPGAYAGDCWYGHPEMRAEPTHLWNGNRWQALPMAS